MYEYTCPVCGKVTEVKKKNQVRTYCSRRCVSMSREARRKDVGLEVEMPCIFQPESIMCGKRECDKCGWNPKVAQERLERIGECLTELQPEDKPKFGEWISANERIPKDRVQVLVFTHTGKVMSLHCNDGIWSAPLNVIVTHWMPMPKPQKE